MARATLGTDNPCPAGDIQVPLLSVLAARALLFITATVSLSFSGDETILPLPMFRGLHYPL